MVAMRNRVMSHEQVFEEQKRSGFCNKVASDSLSLRMILLLWLMRSIRH